MIPRNRSRDSQRKSSPPGPTYMSHDQIANYLSELRTNRPARPNGSRPLPTKPPASMWNRNREFPPRASSAMSSYTTSSTRPAESEDENFRSSSGLSHRRPDSITSLNSSPNRPFVQEPRSVPLRKYASPSQVHVKSSPVSPSATYRENLQRRMEKQEARSLRNALEHMNIDDENRLYDAAQDEATELVWNHQHPGVPYRNPRSEFRNPDLDNARSNSERNGHFRSESLRGPKDTDYRTSRSSLYESLRGLKNLGTGTERSRERPSLDEDASRDKRNWSLRRRNRVNFALPPEESPSNPGSPKPKDTDHDSPQTPFHNSNGHIYEETQASPPSPEEERHGHARSRPPSLKARPRNSLRGTRPLPGRFGKLPLVDMLSRSDMHKNPPSSQSKNPEYITNSPVMKSSKPDSNHVPTKNGIEIRSDDIRAATSKKLSERSANLPTPVGVSDRPGRPIVSFDQTWKPADAPSAKSRERDSLKKRDSDSSASSTQAPAAPAIQVSEEASDVPVINLPDDRVPTISEMSQSQSDQNYDQPSPEQQKGQNRMSASRPVGGTQTKWYTRYTRPGVPTATCEACSQSIAGKIVTASGLRFHPECFVCYHCKTQLECIAFYQEPEAKRTERLAAASTDDREARALRFYCALDFHELFSPRCKSCKTPIEGEVVLACGAEWHVGHFFCAECGDPFDSKTPFVERDGFAWCLGCHSRRTAPRCQGCRQPVMDDVVISAIGGQWHDKCFSCHECGSGFGPDGRFFVRQGEPKRSAKGRIIGGPVQLPICERCEGIRLKS